MSVRDVTLTLDSGKDYGLLDDLALFLTSRPADPRPTLFPYTTLFRSNDDAYAVESWGLIRDWIKAGVTAYSAWNMVLDTVGVRSEEHTSELQSRRDLVCRLLLEKKKKRNERNLQLWSTRHTTK